jgi:uncharacterized membrane protein
MKKYLIAIFLLCVGLYCGFLAFNHIDAWGGIAVTLITIGVFLNYIYKQVGRYISDQLKNNNDEKF